MTDPNEREISREEADEYRDVYGGIPDDCVIKEEPEDHTKQDDE